MTRRGFLASSAAAAAQITPSRPNILFILADDLGYGNLGCYGAKDILTPNLDRLAASGIRFTQAYAGTTVCAPSRCALMTGLHTGHCRTRGNMSPNLPLRPQDLTVTEVLKQSGYRTGLVGKWSLGELGSTGYPTRKGFDEWYGFFDQSHAHNYYPEHLLDGESAVLLTGNTGTRKTAYAPDLFTRRALQFLEKKNEPKPFFLKVSYTSPHANNEMGRDTGNGMEVPNSDQYANRTWPAPDKNFAAMVTRMDSDVGKLLDKLAETGQEQNTLVIFASDNGPHKEGGHNPDLLDDNGPLRGIKRDLYEGGIRVPFLVRWPAVVRPAQVSDHVHAFWDVFPTLADLAGAQTPKGLDGFSWAPLLRGQPTPVHDYLYWEFHEGGFHQAVRMGDWKAVRNGVGQPLELYDLKTDLGEQRNLADRQPEVVRKNEAILAAARTDSPEWPVRR